MTLVTIAAGEFEMGESDADKFAIDTERPRHVVRFAEAFRMATFPVTNGELRRFQPDFAGTSPMSCPP